MLIWCFFLALPVGFAAIIIYGIFRRAMPNSKALLNGLLLGGMLVYLGTCFLLCVPPPAIVDHLLRNDASTWQLLHHIGFPSTKDEQFYFGDMLVALGWLYAIGMALGAGFTRLAQRMPFEPYAAETTQEETD